MQRVTQLRGSRQEGLHLQLDTCVMLIMFWRLIATSRLGSVGCAIATPVTTVDDVAVITTCRDSYSLRAAHNPSALSGGGASPGRSFTRPCVTCTRTPCAAEQPSSSSGSSTSRWWCSSSSINFSSSTAVIGIYPRRVYRRFGRYFGTIIVPTRVPRVA